MLGGDGFKLGGLDAAGGITPHSANPREISTIATVNDSVPPIDASLAEFVRRWQSSGAAERANYVLFLAQRCDVLAVAEPNPTADDPEKNSYVFERDVKFDQGEGTTTPGRIDLYRRGCFVLEAKQGSDAQAADDEAALLLESRGSLRDPQPPSREKVRIGSARGSANKSSLQDHCVSSR